MQELFDIRKIFSPNPGEPEAVGNLRRAARWASAACLVPALLAITGWVFEIQILKSLWSGWATMKFNTAVGIALLAVSLYIGHSKPGRTGKAVATVLQLVVLVTGAATGLEYATGYDFGIDQALMSGAEPGASLPLGRMAIATSIIFCLLAGSALLSLPRSWAFRRYAAILNWCAIALASFVLFGYGSGPQPMYDLLFFRSVALPTAVSLLVLGLSALVLRPYQMPVSLIADPGFAGRSIRGTLPWLVLGPAVVAMIAQIGELSGLYNGLAANGIVVLIVTAAGSIIILRNGLTLQGMDRRRAAAESNLKRSHAELESRVIERTAELQAAVENLASAQREAEAARRVAETASKAKSDFLAGMSHELRTPLNAVIGFAQLLQLDHGHTLTKKQRDYGHYIENAGAHLLSLVNDVLDLAGIEAGRLKLSLERVAIQDMFTRVRTTMLPLAVRSDITLHFDAPERISDVRADDLRLRQVLINLVSNGIKYNRPGGSVSLAAAPMPGGRIRISVTDTGIGIDSERQKRVFEPFNRLGAEYTDVEGTGIGLVLSRKLVAAMNGTLGFFSEVGKGTTFWIDLPADAKAEPHPAAVAARWSAATASAEAGGFALLYVEDNPMNLRLMEDLVATIPNAAMLTAPTPQLGLDLAVAHRPDVIILDLNLPGMSGLEVLARLKAMPATRDVPVIALTAAAFARDAKKALAAGFFRYITKPLDVNAFLAAIGDALAVTPRRRTAGE